MIELVTGFIHLIMNTNNTVETKKITADFKIHLRMRNIFCLKDVFFAILNVAQNSFCEFYYQLRMIRRRGLSYEGYKLFYGTGSYPLPPQG